MVSKYVGFVKIKKNQIYQKFKLLSLKLSVLFCNAPYYVTNQTFHSNLYMRTVEETASHL